MSPEQEEYREDEERDEFASRSIFAAGWFRAVLVLTVLAIVVVISLPYLLNWFEPAPSPTRAAKSTESPPTAATPPLAPSAPAPSVPEGKAAPGTADKAASPKAGSAQSTPPKASPEKAAPAPKTVAEKPAPTQIAAEKPAPAPARKGSTEAAGTPAKTAEKPGAPTKTAKAEPAVKAESPAKPAPAAKSAEAAAGKYWIQLGAFKDQENADALAKTLREAGFPVQVSTINRDPGEAKGASQHELFVADTSTDKVTAALKGRGTAQAVSGGVAVKPAFSLDEAMTVSKRLTAEGLKVVIRPAGGIGGGGTTTLHSVRAGSYPNRTSALVARDELIAKGHEGFLTESQAK